MRHVFWLIENRLAGRPGPDREPWDLSELRASGFDALLSLNEGEGFEMSAASVHGFDHHCARLPPNAPPIEGDEDICLAALPAAYEFVRRQHESGRVVLAHCTAGKDRTGLFMSYYLMREYGLDIDAAIARVRAVRPPAISAPGWDELARGVLKKLIPQSSFTAAVSPARGISGSEKAGGVSSTGDYFDTMTRRTSAPRFDR